MCPPTDGYLNAESDQPPLLRSRHTGNTYAVVDRPLGGEPYGIPRRAPNARSVRCSRTRLVRSVLMGERVLHPVSLRLTVPRDSLFVAKMTDWEYLNLEQVD